MRKLSIGSRLLALLLVLAMVLPMAPAGVFSDLFVVEADAANVGDIGTGTKLGDTGLVNDTIDTSDTISWPIKIYDYLNDGILFEYANAGDSGDIDEDLGGAYGGGSPAPQYGGAAAVIGTDYTVNAGYAETAYTKWLKTYSAFEYSGSLVEAVNFKSPSHLHLVPDNTYTDMKPWIMSDYSADNISTGYSKDTVRYAVVVYRTSGLEDGEAKLNLGWETNLVGSKTYEGTSVNYDYRGSVNLVANSETWNYVVIDMNAGTLGTNWDSITNVYRVIADFQMNDPDDSVDISHVAYFDTEFEAIEFGKDAVAFDNNPGEYLNAHTEYTSGGETITVPVENPTFTYGADYTNSASIKDPSYTEMILTKSQKTYTNANGSNRYYITVSDSDGYRDYSTVASWDSEGVSATLDQTRYAVLVYRTTGLDASTQNKIAFYLEGTTSGKWAYGAGWWADQSFTVSNGTWTYAVFDMADSTAGASSAYSYNYKNDIAVNYSSVGKIAKVGIYFPGFTSSSQSMDISHICFFSSKTAAQNFGKQALAYMEGQTTTTTTSAGSYTTTQKKWNTGNNVAFSMLYANQGGGWYTNGDDDDYAPYSIPGGSNSEPNGYFSYQIGAYAYNYGINYAANTIRNTAKQKNYPVSDTIWLLSDGLRTDADYGLTDSNGKQYYDMSNLDYGYKLFNQLYSGVMTAGLLQSSLTTITDNNNNTYRVPNYKEDTVAYIAYLLRDALAVGKTDASGNYNYNFVSGTKNGAQYGYADADQKEPYDLASALRAQLGYTFPDGGGKASYTAKIGDYETTLAKAGSLIGEFNAVKSNITTFMDAAYYLLMNLYVDNSYNQAQDEYQYLVMSKATLETNGKDAYVFDGGFTTGVTANTANTAAYRASSVSALSYDAAKGTISLLPAANATTVSKDQVYFAESQATTRFPFLPVTDSTGVYAGETVSPYFLDDGRGPMGVTEEGATFVNRNYNYAMASNGEFVYHAEDGLFFDFEGDDDVYLFLNNELVVDVGAAHSVTTVTMNVNDYVTWAQGVLSFLTEKNALGNVYSYTYHDKATDSDVTLTYQAGMSDAKFLTLIEAAWNNNYNSVKSEYSTYDDFEAELLRAHHLNLVDSAAYNFDFYYMERHGWGANCRIATNIVVTDPTMKTDKTAYQDDVEIPYGGQIDDEKPVMYSFSLTNEGNTKLFKMSFKDANIGLQLTYDGGITTFGDPVVTSFTTTVANEVLDITGLNGVMNLDGQVYYLSEDGTITWTEEVLDDDNEPVTESKSNKEEPLTLDAGFHSLVLYQTNSDVLFHDSMVNVNIGDIDNETVVHEAGQASYTLTENKTNRLLVEGVRVSNADGEPLEVSDLIITVDSFSDDQNYNNYVKYMEAGDEATAAQYKLDTLNISLSTNEELKAFLTYLTDPKHQTEEKDDTEKSGIFTGAGLWRHATVTISGFYYTLTDAEKKDGSFTNTVYSYAFGDVDSTKELKGQDTHRVYSGDASYYQWAGHNLLVTKEKLFGDINYAAFREATRTTGTGESAVTTKLDIKYNSDGLTYALCDSAGDTKIYDYVKLNTNGDGYIINYPTAGEETFYVKMAYDIDGNGKSTDDGEFCVVPVTVYVTDVKDSYYVLDYGLTTEDLNTNGELFKNDALRGEYGQDVAKLMGFATTEPTYLTADKSTAVSAVDNVNRIQFNALDMTKGGVVKVEDGHFNIDMSIPATGKTLSYNAFTGVYSLTEAGTMKVNVTNVPENWDKVCLYFWYDSGIDNEWPGTEMVLQSDGSYSLDIPADVTNVIINNGNDTQTVDLTVTSGITNDIELTTTSSDGKIVAKVETGIQTVTIHAKVPNLDQAYLYYWYSETNEDNHWPGDTMTDTDRDGWLDISIPGDVSNVIINNYSDKQTVDLVVTPGKEAWIEVNKEHSYTSEDEKTYYYDAVTRYSLDNYTVNVNVSNVTDWGTPYLYYWYSDNTSTGVAWPGVAMTEQDDGTYSYDVPVGVTNLIITDGTAPVENESYTGKQTENILLHEYTANSVASITVNNRFDAYGHYAATADEDHITFDPEDFMDNEYNIWMAVTVHAVGTKPTALSNATTGNSININTEVQMYKNVTVLPATVVYYEDDFPAIKYAQADADGDNNVNTFTTIGTNTDKFQSVDQEENYGHDSTYEDETNITMSGESLTKVKISDTDLVAYFTFTGTGFELISRTNAYDSTTIRVKIYNSSDVTNGIPKEGAQYVDYITVITEFDNGGDSGTEGIYQVPVIRVDDLGVDTNGDKVIEPASYTVLLYGTPANTYNEDGTTTPRDVYLYIDGLRIYQPLGASNSHYNATENGATFTEIRDLIVDGTVAAATLTDKNLTIGTGTTTWTENRNGKDSNNETWTGNVVDSVNDYLLMGPNNEVYMSSLDNGVAALAFYVTEDGTGTHALQIAVHALDKEMYYGTATAEDGTDLDDSRASAENKAELLYGVKDGESYTWKPLATITSGAEQYYTIPYSECPVVDGKYQIVIKVNSGMASFTNLKYVGLKIESINGEVATLRYGLYGLEKQVGKTWYGFTTKEPGTGYTIRYNGTTEEWEKYGIWNEDKKYDSETQTWYTYNSETGKWDKSGTAKSEVVADVWYVYDSDAKAWVMDKKFDIAASKWYVYDTETESWGEDTSVELSEDGVYTWYKTDSETGNKVAVEKFRDNAWSVYVYSETASTRLDPIEKERKQITIVSVKDSSDAWVSYGKYDETTNSWYEYNPDSEDADEDGWVFVMTVKYDESTGICYQYDPDNNAADDYAEEDGWILYKMYDQTTGILYEYSFEWVQYKKYDDDNSIWYLYDPDSDKADEDGWVLYKKYVASEDKWYVYNVDAKEGEAEWIIDTQNSGVETVDADELVYEEDYPAFEELSGQMYEMTVVNVEEEVEEDIVGDEIVDVGTSETTEPEETEPEEDDTTTSTGSFFDSIKSWFSGWFGNKDQEQTQPTETAPAATEPSETEETVPAETEDSSESGWSKWFSWWPFW